MTNEIDFVRTGKVKATANIFAAGLRRVPRDMEGEADEGGELPTEIKFGPGVRRINFPSITKISDKGINGAPTVFESINHDPEGGAYPDDTPEGRIILDTNIQSYGSISGIKAEDRAMFLVGVFLPHKLEPAPAKPPQPLVFGSTNFDANAIDFNFKKIEPKLYQTFFIGDGKNDDSLQDFIVPDGAGRLYLGFADATYFGGNIEGGQKPGYYKTNVGEVSFEVKFARIEPRPE